jgi:hypothetical protein
MIAKKYALVADDAECDICKASLFHAGRFYDAKTHDGRWGWLCRSCFLAYGKGIGLGFGQEYSSTTKEKLRG